ncbi:RNA polymerase-binding transcription factor DksA [Oxalobacteraceae bacterium GrIS 2.11]
MTASTQHKLNENEIQLRILYDQVREDIVGQLHKADDPATLTLANHILDGGDWTEADVLNDTDIELLHQKINRLRDIELALKQIAAGTYGICSSCGKHIPAERMQALITTQHCLACQSEIEKQTGLRHDRKL